MVSILSVSLGMSQWMFPSPGMFLGWRIMKLTLRRHTPFLHHGEHVVQVYVVTGQLVS